MCACARLSLWSIRITYHIGCVHLLSALNWCSVAGCVVHWRWRSCRQGGVTLSSSEAEYVAASAVAQENAYLRALLSGFDRSPLGPTCVWEDNAACILMSENPVNRDRSRHVDVKFHFLRERVRAGEIKLYKCWGPLNVADALTKSLPRPAFHKHAPFMHGTRSSYRPFTDPGA